MATKDKNVAKKPAAKKASASAKKTTPKPPKVKKCEESLNDSIDYLWGSVLESVEDIQEMVVEALKRLENDDTAAAKKLLEGAVLYLEDFLCEDESDEDDDEDDDDEEDDG